MLPNFKDKQVWRKKTRVNVVLRQIVVIAEKV